MMGITSIAMSWLLLLLLLLLLLVVLAVFCGWWCLFSKGAAKVARYSKGSVRQRRARRQKTAGARVAEGLDEAGPHVANVSVQAAFKL